MDVNSNCYTFKKIIYDNPILNNVSATYIIHLKDNGRLKHVEEQLKEYQPTKIVYIVFNEGFKKCKKPEFINTTATDLIDTNLHILKHSKNMNYNNILILEDDFIFSQKIKDNFHQNNISDFLERNKQKPFIYLLGCAPIFLIPYNYYNYRTILSIGTHAVIYNTQMKDIILSYNQENMKDWDELFLFSFFKYRYVYYTPLCYQLFPDTENSKGWGKTNNIIFYIGAQFIKLLFKILNMDIQEEPGYSIFYIISKLLLFIFFIVIIFIVIIILIFKSNNCHLTNYINGNLTNYINGNLNNITIL